MKNLIILSAAVTVMPVLFLACGKEKNTADYIVSDNFTMYTDISYPETPIDEIDLLTPTAPSTKFTYAINGSSVELFIDNNRIKVIDCPYIPSAANIFVADFNFDGYGDIFIPYDDPKDYGTYWCYVPGRNDFYKNSELNSVGKIMTVSENDTLVQDMSDDLTARTIEYQWSKGKLKAIRKTEKYRSAEDNKIHTDVYSYNDNGTEHLEDTIIEGG